MVTILAVTMAGACISGVRTTYVLCVQLQELIMAVWLLVLRWVHVFDRGIKYDGLLDPLDVIIQDGSRKTTSLLGVIDWYNDRE